MLGTPVEAGGGIGMERLRDYWKWNIENPHNVNFKMVVSKEDREDTLQAMKDMIELFDTGLTAEDIKDIFIVISESQDDVDENGISDGILRALIELAHYRNTGLTPEQLRQVDEEFSRVSKELGEYKKAEEQSLIPRFPCKIGDIIYEVFAGHVMPSRVIGFRLGRMMGEEIEEYEEEYGPLDTPRVEFEQMGATASVPITKFGKSLFLTKKEALEKLKEIKGSRIGEDLEYIVEKEEQP